MGQINAKHTACLLLTGATVGAAIALLYAPQSGAQTKKDIRKFTRNTVTRLDDLQGEIRDNVAEWVDGVTDVVQDGVERGKKLGAEGYEQVLQSFDNAKMCVEDGKRRIELLIKTA